MRSHGYEHEHEHGHGHLRARPSRSGRRRGAARGLRALRAGFGARPFGPVVPSVAGAAGADGRGRARRGDVRASILALLKDRPMHGYEMIQEIGERSGGAWKPSPGSVYPTLQLLEDEGLIASASEGGKKLFSLTEPGRTEAESGPEAPWEEAGRGVDWEALNEIRQAGFGLMEAFGQVWKTGSQEQREKALTVINEARKKLYLILADED